MAEPDLRVEGRGAGGLLDPAELRVLAHVWKQFWWSRSAVWIVGLLALLAFGPPTGTVDRLDPYSFTVPFESSGLNALIAPAVGWDSAHYLGIATFGYAAPESPAFFPLYPSLLALGGGGTGSMLLGIGLSIVFSLAALLVVHRLVSIDFGPVIAASTVAIIAWFPSALVLSAVYTDALFLLLSAGSLLAGRLNNWPLAGLLGALAAATRSAGVLLIVPLLVLYLFGPRRGTRSLGSRHRFGPRYALRPDVAWVFLVPVGLVAYMAYLGEVTGDPTALFGPRTDGSGWSPHSPVCRCRSGRRSRGSGSSCPE